jgi:hypothetical protein
MIDPTLFSTLLPSRIWLASAHPAPLFLAKQAPLLNSAHAGCVGASQGIYRHFGVVHELTLSMRFIRLNDCAAVGTQVLFPAADK